MLRAHSLAAAKVPQPSTGSMKQSYWTSHRTVVEPLSLGYLSFNMGNKIFKLVLRGDLSLSIKSLSAVVMACMQETRKTAWTASYVVCLAGRAQSTLLLQPTLAARHQQARHQKLPVTHFQCARQITTHQR